MAIITELESMRRKFFWGMKKDENKISWVSWKKVMASKEVGGMGFLA